MKKNIFIISILCVVLLFTSAYLGDKIINEPLWLLLGVFIISAFLFKKPVFEFFDSKEEKTGKQKGTTFLIGIMWLSITFALTFSIFAPIRFVIVTASKKNPETIIACDIVSFHKKAKNKKMKLWYEFNGHKNMKKLKVDEYKKLQEGRNSKKYKIYLTVRKSIFGTEVIQEYKIQE